MMYLVSRLFQESKNILKEGLKNYSLQNSNQYTRDKMSINNISL